MTTTAAAARRVVLVTGASRGIGAAIASAFAATGAHAVLAARDGEALEHVADDIRATGGTADTYPLDVTDEQAVHGLIARIERRHGRLDAAVNNAGGSRRRPDLLQRWSEAEFTAAVAANLTGTFLCLKHELALMAGAGGGAIVNMSSTAAQHPVAGLAGYTAAKSGVEALTRVAALDNAANGIRVNAIAPGAVLTEQLAAAGPTAQAATAATVPLGRLATPADIAAAALWLCSPDSSYISGTTLIIDGARTAGTRPD
jgi:NAD(P)-dependent dehydrogenase (short-subunit alcohol dehydrogenase family)